MKKAIQILGLALCGSLAASAQVQLMGCGLRLPAAGAVGFSCLTGMPISDRTLNQTVCDGHCNLAADSIVLEPGATLTRPVPGEVDFIVAQGEGELTNEAKSPSISVVLGAGLVLFMPEQEPYALKNVGKKDVHLLVIRMQPSKEPAPPRP
jgi:quercetin dioxygenase-like cupin family protein